MKKILSALMAVIVAGTSLVSTAYLQTVGPVTQLEIVAPTTARVGEAIDITVRAIDKDKNTVTSYRGSVIFNTDNVGDTVPMPGKAYTFTPDDNGTKTFSKGLIFKKSGKQKVYVTDLSSDNIDGTATITVEAAGPTTGADQSISIITPENGTSIPGDSVMVSGKTRKNSKVNVKLNGKDAGSTTSDDSGIFTKNVTGIAQDSNLLVAELIDGQNTVVATSPEVKFTRTTVSSATYGITILPSSTVEASSPIEIVVDATPGLAELSILMDNAVLPAKEGTSGKYSLKTVAPSQSGSYAIGISQKDSLGQTKTADRQATLTVIDAMQAPKVGPMFKNIKAVTQGSRITFDFMVENAPAELRSFKIAYGKDANSLSNEVNTFTLDRIASKTLSGGYTWYIDKLEAATYTFKIFGRDASGALISGLVSEPIVATLGTDSCTIGNVGNLRVATDTSKSIISWDAIPGAISYNLYKVSPAGDYVLFQNVKEPKYTLFLSKGAVTYDNFVVKALCDDKTESKDYSAMSRVQSGPGAVAVVVVIAALIGAFIMRRRSIS